jgi:hypothetical protein
MSADEAFDLMGPCICVVVFCPTATCVPAALVFPLKPARATDWSIRSQPRAESDKHFLSIPNVRTIAVW